MHIDRRTFLTTSAKVVLTVTTFGSVRVARAHEVSLAARPWSAAGEAMSADPRIRAMAYAILAPNAFNLQPWLAELPGEDMLMLRCDPALRLPELDAEDRMTVISFGNFLELLRMAAAKDGYRVVVEPFPEGEPFPRLDGRPIASVRFIHGGAIPDPLFPQALERRSCKRPYEPRPVNNAALTQLCSAGEAGTWVRSSRDTKLVAKIRDLALQAFVLEKHTPRINLEQVRITRFGEEQVEASPDGIDLLGTAVETAVAADTLNAVTLADADSSASQDATNLYRTLCDTAQAYVWMSTPGNSRRDQLNAGRDWLRVHLKATELGLSFDPQSPTLNSYPEVAQLAQRMHETLEVPPGRRLQMLSRLGYAAQSPPAARWAVETRILAT